MLFEDEALVKFHPQLSRVWSKIGERREIATVDDHGKCAVFGSVNPFSGEVFHTYGNTINQTIFLTHLNQITERYPENCVILVLDNCKSHFTIKVQKFLEANKKLFLLFLPPYSPDFNVIERLWQRIRKSVTNNFLFRNLDEVKLAVSQYLEFVSSDEIKNLCMI